MVRGEESPLIYVLKHACLYFAALYTLEQLIDGGLVESFSQNTEHHDTWSACLNIQSICCKFLQVPSESPS